MPRPIAAVPVLDFAHLATVEELAPELHVSVWTLREMCRRGEFPHVRLPGRRRILIDRRHVAELLEGADLEVKRLARGGRVVKPVRGRS